MFNKPQQGIAPPQNGVKKENGKQYDWRHFGELNEAYLRQQIQQQCEIVAFLR